MSQTQIEKRLDMLEEKINILIENQSINAESRLEPRNRSRYNNIYTTGQQTWKSLSHEMLKYSIADLRDNIQSNVKEANDIYGKTLNALRSKEGGMTADEVGKITNRNRNTESSYLWKLHLAGVINRINKGRKVLYSIKNTD